MSFFQQNSECIVHHVIDPIGSQMLMDELLSSHQQIKGTMMIQSDYDESEHRGGKIKENILLTPNAIHTLGFLHMSRWPYWRRNIDLDVLGHWLYFGLSMGN